MTALSTTADGWTAHSTAAATWSTTAKTTTATGTPRMGSPFLVSVLELDFFFSVNVAVSGLVSFQFSFQFFFFFERHSLSHSQAWRGHRHSSGLKADLRMEVCARQRY
jgi:hypothetical protein